MGWRPTEGSTVVDETGARHQLTTKLAEGGEGAIYSTAAGGAVVKILVNQGLVDDLHRRIRRVARLPLADLPTALPRHVLCDAAGYTMPLITGMVNATALFGFERPMPPDGYIQTGGLRRRLAIVANMFDLIGAFHARGLVIGDLSAANVLVSDAHHKSRIALIDLDNVTVQGDRGSTAATSPFAAPEQFSEGATAQTDVFCASVLTYWAIVGSNPFYGPVLDDLPWEELLQEKVAWSARAAWVLDAASDNSGGYGYRRNLDQRLRNLLERALGVGRLEPALRPQAPELAAAARSALGASVDCLGCGWHVYHLDDRCDHCNRPAACTRLALWGLSETGPIAHRSRHHILVGEDEVVISSRGLVLGPPEERAIVARTDAGGVHVECLDRRLRPRSQRVTCTLRAGDALVLDRPTGMPLLLTVEGEPGG